MIRGIDISVVMKNIDKTAKIMKNKEASLDLQQIHASNELVKEADLKKKKVNKSEETNLEMITLNKQNEEELKSKIKKQKSKESREKRRHNNPNKGRWLDLEI